MPPASERPVMATETPRQRIKDNVAAVTVLLTIVGYGLVAGTFQGWLPLFPEISQSGVNLLGHAIAVVNTLAVCCLATGWYWIRNGEVDKHRAAMSAAFALIVLFLLLYLPKVGGGGQKVIVDTVPDLVRYSYYVMLLIHVLLSIVAMPIVLYAFLLGLTHSPAELRQTPHARIGRIAAGSWILSLVLGVITYLILNHAYGYTFEPALVALA
jgi:putative membrane protein